MSWPSQSPKDTIYNLVCEFLTNAGPIANRAAQSAVFGVLKDVRSGADELPVDPSDLEIRHIRVAELTGFHRNVLKEAKPAIPPRYRRQFQILAKLLGEDDS